MRKLFWVDYFFPAEDVDNKDVEVLSYLTVSTSRKHAEISCRNMNGPEVIHIKGIKKVAEV